MTQQLAPDITVPEAFDAAAESERRITFLADYLKASGARAYVLGISGGVDPLTSGLLAQAAVERLREQGHAPNSWQCVCPMACRRTRRMHGNLWRPSPPTAW
jgi:NAD+ synthase